MSSFSSPPTERIETRERTAIFHRDDSEQAEAPSLTTCFVRKASFRPTEEIAVRRDIVEAFRTSCMQDISHHGDAQNVASAGLRGAILAEESLGRWNQAAQLVTRLKRAHTFASEDWAIARRIYRALNESGWVAESLEKEWQEVQSTDDLQGMFVCLERALVAWRSGMPSADVLRWLDCATRDINWEEIPEFSLLWLTQLQLDALLESGRVDEALERLEYVTNHASLESVTRRYLLCQRAIWLNTLGRVDEAIAVLADAAGQAELPGDLAETYIGLLSESGHREALLEFLCEEQTRLDLRDSLGMTYAKLLEVVANNASESRTVLRSTTATQGEDWTRLRARKHLLDRDEFRSDKSASTELIDVLNLLLESPLSDDERVDVLTRLGRLYEVEAKLEEAAAEVYREALLLKHDHLPVYRALGRLYMRRQNWQGLAELYEREIEVFKSSAGVWRKHYQVAQIYDQRLHQYDKSIAHYKTVLDYKSHYLPAVKALSRLLSDCEQWSDFVELFGSLAQTAPNQRQKIYLLEKVADVAETRVENLDIAIDAWRQIHTLEPEDLRSFSALGRLYSRTLRWEELLELNLAEVQLLDDPEEVAALYLRNAEVCESELCDWERAERFYQMALEQLPDYLPALEGLGRIFGQSGRWEEIVQMTGSELRAIDEPMEVLRQMDTLAELYETRLERRTEAIEVYEEILQRDSSNLHAYFALQRIHRNEGQWDRVLQLVHQRLRTTLVDSERTALLGEVAMLNEWRLCDFSAAFDYYMAALKREPANVYWLDGVARTWLNAQQKPGTVADELEDLLMQAMQASIRDRYFIVIARLRERAEQCPEASRAYRAHGMANSLENQLVLRMAMARGQERDALAKARCMQPHIALEALIHCERSNFDNETFKRLKASLTRLHAQEKQWLVREMPVQMSSPLVPDTAPHHQVLSRDLITILQGGSLHAGMLEHLDPRGHLPRLRALEAKQAGDLTSYARWTRLETRQVDARDVVVRRLLELAEFASRANDSEISLPELYEEIANQAFPELAETAEIVQVNGCDEEAEVAQSEQLDITDALADLDENNHDGPTLDYLYEALTGAEQWGLLRDCLNAHVARKGLSVNRRLYLFEMLADILENRIDNISGAIDAQQHCWNLSEDPKYLRDIVRLNLKINDLKQAIVFQQRHYEVLAQNEDTRPADQIESGMWLAELLIQDEGRLGHGIDCLEFLLASFQDEPILIEARRQLAHAYAKAQQAFRAVEMFQSVLDAELSESELGDWRRLIEVYRFQVQDIATAYNLQWKVVRGFAHISTEVDYLFELARQTRQLPDCLRQIEQLARTTDESTRIELLSKAVHTADVELQWAEEAVRLYQQLIALLPDNHENRSHCRRRFAYCLAQIAGREDDALAAFRELGEEEPLDEAVYQGLASLFERTQSLDRLRVVRQVLRALGQDVQDVSGRIKTRPSRPLGEAMIAESMMPEILQNGVFDVLQAVTPLAEKAWNDALPQRKALVGERLKGEKLDKIGPVFDMVQEAFEIKRIKILVGDGGSMAPQVLNESTPVVWLHNELLDQLSAAQLRFVAGYCVALAWSKMPSLMALDGRKIWHLLEGVWLRQQSQGFSDRVDIASQKLGEQFGGAFHLSARRKVTQVLEPVIEQMADVHCEVWPQAVQDFALRCGLVFCGDVAEAVRCILRMEGCDLELAESAVQKQLKNSHSVESLIQFALSDAYLQARYALGLSGRPSQLNV